MTKKAVILVSGGLDSATILAIAKKQGYECYALSINYNQRNQIENDAAIRVTKASDVAQHRIIKLEIGDWGGSSLTDFSLDVPHSFNKDIIPSTYVPARNTIFLSVALAWAEVLGAFDIFIGVNAIDYSNYPDCRPEYIAAFEKLAKLATRAGVEGETFKIHTPLINLSKAEIIKKGTELGVDYSLTISCYDPTQEAAACGLCDACRLRAKGFKEAGIKDVTKYAVETTYP